MNIDRSDIADQPVNYLQSDYRFYIILEVKLTQVIYIFLNVSSLLGGAPVKNWQVGVFSTVVHFLKHLTILKHLMTER